MSVSGPSARILHADTAEVGSLPAEHAREISEAVRYRHTAGVAETAPPRADAAGAGMRRSSAELR